MVLLSDLELIQQFFEPAPRYNGTKRHLRNISSYRGKHILERHRVERYMSEDEFIECMNHLQIQRYRNTDIYPIRLRKQYRGL